MSTTAIFENDNAESATQIVRSTMSVSLNDAGTPVVSFAVNRGKGTGAQTIPVSEFRDAVSALQQLVDNGMESSELEPSASDTIRSTASCSDGMVSFRTRSGKGSKPAKIPSESFADVVTLLQTTVDAVEGAGESLAPDVTGEDTD
jgi:hypothetical protein